MFRFLCKRNFNSLINKIVWRRQLKLWNSNRVKNCCLKKKKTTLIPLQDDRKSCFVSYVCKFDSLINKMVWLSQLKLWIAVNNVDWRKKKLQFHSLCYSNVTSLIERLIQEGQKRLKICFSLAPVKKQVSRAFGTD